MMRRMLWVVAVMLALTGAAAGQEVEWEAVFFDPGGARVLTLGADGLIAEVTLAEYAGFEVAGAPVLAPGGEYLAFTTLTFRDAENLPPLDAIQIARAGVCCLAIDMPAGLTGLGLGEFDPLGRWLMAWERYADAALNRLAVYDAASGALVTQMPAGAFTLPGATTDWVTFGVWDAEGAHFQPQCNFCQPPLPLTTFRWRVEPSDDIQPVLDAPSVEMLLTGERITETLLEGYAFNPPGSMRVAGNVIAYRGAGSAPDEWAVVFHDATLPAIVDVDWVLDGAGALALFDGEEAPLGLVLLRDGTREVLPLPPGDWLGLTGTPDGVILLNRAREGDSQLVYWRRGAGGWEVVAAVSVRGDTYALRSPRLGASVSGGFPVFGD